VPCSKSYLESGLGPRTTFSGDDLKWVSFKSAKFLGKADFRHAAFSPSDNINFSTTIFEGLPTFDEAKFGTQTSFQEATFLRFPPNFFGATLHEHTVWRGVKHWPIPSSCPRQAGLTRHPMGGAQHARTGVRAALTQRAKELDQGDHRPAEETPDDPGLFVDCYERLKLEMDRLKKHDDELFFFTQEMRCRRILQGSWGGLPLAIYGALCEYGRSFARPLYWILVTIVLGALALWPHFGLAKFEKALGLSIANTFAVLGLRKELVASHVLEELSDFLTVLTGIQTVLGAILLFLFGLGLRNSFRMR
jgi:hypothetical protein